MLDFILGRPLASEEDKGERVGPLAEVSVFGLDAFTWNQRYVWHADGQAVLDKIRRAWEERQQASPGKMLDLA